MIPMRDGKVAWPKGFGSKKERLDFLEREYAKRLEDIKALQALIHALSEVADDFTDSDHAHKIFLSATNAADNLDKAIYISYGAKPDPEPAK